MPDIKTHKNINERLLPTNDEKSSYEGDCDEVAFCEVPAPYSTEKEIVPKGDLPLYTSFIVSCTRNINDI